jgi:hypothetical protein
MWQFENAWGNFCDFWTYEMADKLGWFDAIYFNS